VSAQADPRTSADPTRGSPKVAHAFAKGRRALTDPAVPAIVLGAGLAAAVWVNVPIALWAVLGAATGYSLSGSV
jgi:hypothetical protein